MSLTKEDLQAISDLMDVKLNERLSVQDKRFDAIDKRFDAIDKRFDEQDEEFKEILDVRLDEQDEKFKEMLDVRLNEQDEKFKEMLIDNNLLIAEHVQRVVSESEERLSKEIQEIKIATAQNSYDIAVLKLKIS
jgi:hypothetical protein